MEQNLEVFFAAYNRFERNENYETKREFLEACRTLEETHGRLTWFQSMKYKAMY
jgi:hypothetical protein